MNKGVSQSGGQRMTGHTPQVGSPSTLHQCVSQWLSGCEKSTNTKCGSAQWAAAASATPKAAASAVAAVVVPSDGNHTATAVEAIAALSPAVRALRNVRSAPLQAEQCSVWLLSRSSSTRLEGSAGGRLPLRPAQGMPAGPPAGWSQAG